MYFYQNLYTDTTTYKKREKICRYLKTGRGQLGVYVIAVGHGSDLFEIYHAANLKQKGFPKKDVIVLGIASSYDSAVSLSIDMFQDLYCRYGLLFKQLFLEKEQNMFRR